MIILSNKILAHIFKLTESNIRRGSPWRSENASFIQEATRHKYTFS